MDSLTLPEAETALYHHPLCGAQCPPHF